MKLLFNKKDNSTKVYLLSKDDKLIIKKKFFKKYWISKKQVEHIFNEKEILEYIKNKDIKNCNKLINSSKDHDGPELYLELINGCPLSNLLKTHFRLNKDFVKLIIFQLINILNDLHLNNILYRDLKASNILINADGYANLIDFGLSKILKAENDFLTDSICGTPHSIAPEILENKKYSFYVDLYNLGILMYELLIGEPPYGYKHTFESIKKEYDEEIDYSLLDEEEIELLKILLSKNFEKRNFKIIDLLDFKYFNSLKNIKMDNIEKKEIIEKYKLCYYQTTINDYIKNNLNLKKTENPNYKEDIFKDF